VPSAYEKLNLQYATILQQWSQNLLRVYTRLLRKTLMRIACVDAVM